jgi:hypothetical protein
MMTLADSRSRLGSTRDSAGASHLVHWILRVSVWACYVGHGMFGIRQKVDWLTFYRPFGIPGAIATHTMPLIGLVDVTMGYLVLLRPTRVVLMYTAAWGIFTALLRPLVGMSFFETLERAGNYGPSIALLLGSAGAALLARPEIYDLSVETNFRRRRLALVITTSLLVLGHGGLALMAKPQLVEHWHSLGVIGLDAGGQALVRMTGVAEVAAAVLLLVWPNRPLCLIIVAWKLFTETLFLTSGAPIWEVVERGGSYGAPLALFVFLTYGASRARTGVPLPFAPERPGSHSAMAGSSARSG